METKSVKRATRALRAHRTPTETARDLVELFGQGQAYDVADARWSAARSDRRRAFWEAVAIEVIRRPRALENKAEGRHE